MYSLECQGIFRRTGRRRVAVRDSTDAPRVRSYEKRGKAKNLQRPEHLTDHDCLTAFPRTEAYCPASSRGQDVAVRRCPSLRSARVFRRSAKKSGGQWFESTTGRQSVPLAQPVRAPDCNSVRPAGAYPAPPEARDVSAPGTERGLRPAGNSRRTGTSASRSRIPIRAAASQPRAARIRSVQGPEAACAHLKQTSAVAKGGVPRLHFRNFF